MARSKMTSAEKKQLLSLLKKATNEMGEEVDDFIHQEVLQNSPELSDYLKALDKSGPPTPHPKHGLNTHHLTCGRCGRNTRLGVPLFNKNALWRCPTCKETRYDVEDDFQKCECGTDMIQAHVLEKGDAVHFDYLCGGCRRNKDAQTKIAKEGGAIVRCQRCHTLGALNKDQPTVKKFRKDYKVPADIILGFTMEDSQCPRCADWQAQRGFTAKELKGVFLVEEDLNVVAQHFESTKTSKGDAVKKSPTEAKETPRENEVDAMAKKATNAFLDELEPTTGSFVRHPGSKSSH